MMGRKNLILIGMPGAGKSTVGSALSEKIGYGYVDSDHVIIAREGKSLPEIIAERGMDGFLDVEAKVNAELCVDRCVIATGGSVIYRESAMKALKKMGKIVYLQLSYAEIAKRLGDLTKRGVAIEGGKTLLDLYQERVPLYEKYADIVANLEGCSIAQAVEKIVEALQK